MELKHNPLNPCPFCGSSKALFTATHLGTGAIFHVVCDGCSAKSGLYSTAKAAREAWNAVGHVEEPLEKEQPSPTCARCGRLVNSAHAYHFDGHTVCCDDCAEDAQKMRQWVIELLKQQSAPLVYKYSDTAVEMLSQLVEHVKDNQCHLSRQLARSNVVAKCIAVDYSRPVPDVPTEKAIALLEKVAGAWFNDCRIQQKDDFNCNLYDEAVTFINAYSRNR